jgi:hypothetical protein
MGRAAHGGRDVATPRAWGARQPRGRPARETRASRRARRRRPSGCGHLTQPGTRSVVSPKLRFRRGVGPGAHFVATPDTETPLALSISPCGTQRATDQSLLQPPPTSSSFEEARQAPNCLPAPSSEPTQPRRLLLMRRGEADSAACVCPVAGGGSRDRERRREREAPRAVSQQQQPPQPTPVTVVPPPEVTPAAPAGAWWVTPATVVVAPQRPPPPPPPPQGPVKVRAASPAFVSWGQLHPLTPTLNPTLARHEHRSRPTPLDETESCTPDLSMEGPTELGFRVV